MSTLELPGLDPLDPLGFLATLGVLAATSEEARRNDATPPRLGFSRGASPRSLLRSRFETLEQLAEALVDDLERLSGRREGSPRDPFLGFSYPDAKGRPVHDLKPPPEAFTEAAHVHIGEASVSHRRTVDWFAAVLTDVAVDNNGAGKPFALHFTAGQQKFLNVALELVDGAGKHPAVQREDILNALEGPWANDRPLKVFSWSPTQERSYALRAVDPSSDAKLGTPGADWLAFRGVSLLSSAPIRDSIVTGGVCGGWKDATFTYPVWPTDLDLDTVRALLRHPALVSDDRRALETWPRNAERWTCRITRSDQGGYGAFSRPTRKS